MTRRRSRRRRLGRVERDARRRGRRLGPHPREETRGGTRAGTRGVREETPRGGATRRDAIAQRRVSQNEATWSAHSEDHARGTRLHERRERVQTRVHERAARRRAEIRHRRRV